MELQPFQAQELALAQSRQISEEELVKRKEEAEQLDEKLRFIVEHIPDRKYHVMGSNAGAGSGEYHMYRASRRREQERLQRIEEEDKEKQQLREWKEQLEQMRQQDEERTSRKRAKRLKKKEKQRSKRQKNCSGEGPADGSGAAGGAEGSSSDEERVVEQIVQPDLD